MSDTQSNFGFMKEHDEQLFSFGELAERYFSSDPNTSMLKIRQFIESLVQLTATHTNCAIQESMTLYDVLKMLLHEGIIARDIGRLFHKVRIACNNANHAFVDEHREALTALKHAREIAIWFHREFGPDPTFSPGPFLHPSNPEDPTTLLEQQLDELRAEYEQAREEAAQAQLSVEALRRQQELLERETERLREDQEVFEVIAEEEERRRTEIAREYELAKEEAVALRERVEAFEMSLQSSQQITRMHHQGALPGGYHLEMEDDLFDSQRQLAYASFPGPVRFHGSAGTGKTVTLLHRAKHLLESHEGHDILISTASIAVPEMLEEQFSLLVPTEHPHRTRVDLKLLPAIASTFYYHAKNHPFEYKQERLPEIFADVYERHAPLPWPMEVLKAEFDMVIDPMGVRSAEEYLEVPRVGRGTRLGRLARVKLWPLFEDVYEELERGQLSTYDDLYLVAARWLEKHPEQKPYNHVLIDESQDLSYAALLFIRALVAPGEDDITLVGDTGQRTMGHKTSWRRAGVELEGRSYQLDVNFRTTERVRLASESILPLHMEGPDGEVDVRASVSLELGEPIVLVAATTPEEEAFALAGWLEELITTRGLSPDRIALTYFSSNAKTSTHEHTLDRGKTIAMKALEIRSLAEKTDQREGVWVRPVRSIKGLEFDAVGIVDCSAVKVPREHLLEVIADPGDHQNARERESRYLYIAATRARRLLWISWSGEPSPLLDPIRRLVPTRTAASG